MNVENNNLEYKKAESQLPTSFWETYSAFANTDGGTIVLGIDENNKENQIQGVKNPIKIRDDIFALAENKQKVSHNVLNSNDVEILDIDGKESKLILVTVSEAHPSKKPVYLKNKLELSYKRLGAGDVKLNNDDLKYLISSSSSESDNELLNGYDESDLNHNTIDKFRSLLVSQTNNEKYINMTNRDLLIELGAMKKDRQNNEYKLTSGGLLFFGKFNSITDRFPKFQLDYFERSSSLSERWSDRVSTGDMFYPDLNVFDFYLIVLDKLLKSVKDSFKLDENQMRLPVKSELEEAVREAFTNCFMHAYYDSDMPIVINAYEDYYEFKNPGKMKVSINEFIHGGSSVTRNSTIPTLLRRVGFSEKAGSGGPKLFDTASKLHLKLPEIYTDFDKTIVNLWKVDLLSSYRDLQGIELDIIKFIIENGSITKNDALEILSITEYQFRIHLTNLLEAKHIEIEGKGRSTRYKLPANSIERVHQIKQSLKELENSINK